MSERKKIKVPEFDGDIPIIEDEGKMRAMRALRDIGEAMERDHVAESLGLYTDEDIVKFIKDFRRERRERQQHESAV